MLEVQSLKQATNAVEEFKHSYAKRYGHLPILEREIELQLFLKSLIKKFGETRVSELIQHYFKYDGDNDWWKRKGHSAKTFQFEIEAINGSLSLTTRSPAPRNLGQGLAVRFETQCPNCNAWHNIVCQGSQMEKHAYTSLCQGCINRRE